MTFQVALDVQALQAEGWADRGVGRYVAGYSLALHREGLLGAALIAAELPPPAGLPAELVASGKASWDTAALCREMLSKGEPVVYHVTAPFLHCAPGEPAALGIAEHWVRTAPPRAVLLHDLIPLRAPTHYLPNRARELRYRARAEWVGAADLVLTNSEHTRLEAVNLLGRDPASVVAVGAGVSAFFSPPDGTDEDLWRFHFEELTSAPFLLAVGGSDARKGTERAIAALGQLVPRGFDLRLLVAGHLTIEWRRRLRMLSSACGVDGRVVLAGGLSDEVLRAAYRRAELTVMPSLAEGAGLPVLESAACGTPALASASTALAETAATHAALFDAGDVDSITETIVRALDDRHLLSRILSVQANLAAQSTWDAVGGRAAVALERLALASPTPAAPRHRLALVVSNTAESARLAALSSSLQAHFDTEIIPGLALGQDVRPSAYDHLVYVGGDRALPCPAGWFWLPEGSAGAGLAPFARGFLVDSEQARRRLEADLPPLGGHPPVAVIAGDPATAIASAVATV